MPITLSVYKSNKNKYLRIDLTEEGQDLYAGSYGTLLREMKGGLSKQRDISCSWIKRLDNVKNSNSSQIDLWIQCDPSQIPEYFFFW